MTASNSSWTKTAQTIIHLRLKNHILACYTEHMNLTSMAPSVSFVMSARRWFSFKKTTLLNVPKDLSRLYALTTDSTQRIVSVAPKAWTNARSCSGFRFRSQIWYQFVVCQHSGCNGLVNTVKLTGDQWQDISAKPQSNHVTSGAYSDAFTVRGKLDISRATTPPKFWKDENKNSDGRNLEIIRLIALILCVI